MMVSEVTGFQIIEIIADGPKGKDGWTPRFANVADDERVVQQVIDWFGGTGTKPEVGIYVGENGFVSDIADAVDIRGATGSAEPAAAAAALAAQQSAVSAAQDAITAAQSSAAAQVAKSDAQGSAALSVEAAGRVPHKTLEDANSDIPNRSKLSWVYAETAASGLNGWYDPWVEVLGRVKSVSQPADGNALAKINSTPHNVPLIVTGDRAFAWAEDGAFSIMSLASHLVRQVTDTITKKFNIALSFIPFITTDERILAWFERDGGVNFAKLSTGLLDTITRYVIQNSPAAKVYALRNQPLTAVAPKCTDGRTLHRLRAKMGRIKQGEIEKVIIAGAGDSWIEQVKMWLALSDEFGSNDGIVKAGQGFISTLTTPLGFLPGLVSTKSGWSTWAAPNQTLPPPFGSGPDGAMQYTTGTTAVAHLELVCTEFSILQRNYGGTYRYRVDGGSWTSVTLATDTQASRTVISGLSNGLHVFDIDTVPNTANVVIGGYYATTAGVAGYEFLKMGVGGITSAMMELFRPYVADYVTMMKPDLVIINETTNDMNTTGATPAIARTALLNMINAYRSAVPDIGIILIAPALNGRSVSTPQAQYRDVMYQLALDNGCEFMNWQDVMGTYLQTNPLGQWQDNAHLSQPGMRNGVRMLYNNFFKA